MERAFSEYSFEEEHVAEFLEADEVDASRSATEMVAKLVVTLSVSVARAFLHAPTDRLLARAAESSVLPSGLKERAAQAAEEAPDFAALADKLISMSTQLLRDRGLSRPEFEMTGEAFSVLLRLATQFMGPIQGLSSSQVYDCTKAYVMMQKHARPTGQPRLSLSRLVKSKLGTSPVPVEDLRRYTRFTMAAYGALAMKFLGVLPRSDRKVWDNTQAIEYLTGIPTQDNLVAARWRANWVGSIYKPGYFVLLDHEQREVIVAVRGSYRFQDSLTDLMCEDTPFSFHYHKTEDLANAKRELNEVFSSLTDAISGISSSAEDLTLGELETEMRSTTQHLFAGLQGFLARQSKLVGEELQAALEVSSGESSSEDEDAEDDEAEALAREARRASRRAARAEARGDAEAAAEARAAADAAAQASAARRAAREPTKYVTKSKSKADAAGQTGEAGVAEAPDGHRHVKGRAHFGFLKAAQILAGELEDVVVGAMRAHRDYKLVVVGHSLGSAVASIMTLMWAQHPVLKSARCYGIAPPASMSLEVAESPIAVAKITSVVLHDDIVPRLSLGAVSDLRNSIHYVGTRHVKGDKQERTVVQFVNDVVDSGVGEDKLAATFAPIMARIRKTEHVHTKLYPPGTLWHIPAQGATIESAVRKKSSDFDELILSRSCFVEHVPHSYAYAVCDKLPLSEQQARLERRAESNKAAASSTGKRTSLAKRLSNSRKAN